MVITRLHEQLLTVLFSGQKALEISIEDESSALGNIYVGRVKHIVKNINAAFLSFADGFTGYYSLTEHPAPLYADGKLRDRLREGDELIVQVERDAVKTKDPVLTSHLSFSGQYAVLIWGKQQVGFSSRIQDREWKNKVRPMLEELLEDEMGVIVRTNAYERQEALCEEICRLKDCFRQVIKKAAYRTGGSLLWKAEPEYCKRLKGMNQESLGEVVTDCPDVLESLNTYIGKQNLNLNWKIRFYEDSMISLLKLYSLETVLEQACQKRVWLKSGGYLVIEYTEAMTVIDVNTGKYTGKKSMPDTIRMTNLEAAEEVTRQLRLRNLSGIILVDFIDMKEQKNRELLMDTLRAYAVQDPVRTVVVDMTPLGLVEITRKKEKKPLWEQLNKGEYGNCKRGN